MAVIDTNANVIADTWVYDTETAGPNSIVPLEGFQEAGAGGVRPLGVRIPSDTKIEKIVALLNQVDLVLIEFPKFRDGRGFTLARALRERYGYKGEIRAVGHVIPDQFDFLVSCGFSSLITPDEHPPEQWAPAAARRAAIKSGKAPLQLLNRLTGPRANG